LNQKPSEESLHRRLIRADAQIKTEFDLIGHRVSWLLVSNSFLFAALVVGLGNSSADVTNRRIVGVLLWALPLIGLASSTLVALAVLAAHDVIKDLKVERGKLEEEAYQLYRYERLGVQVKSWPHLVGNWPPILMPPLLMVIWAISLYLRLSS
jgi:hypothetical protein